MSISIIIPVLNESEQLTHLIPFLIKNGAPAVVEIIVVDGGSGDHSVEIARQLGAKVLCSTRGRSVQMNAGARAAAGNILYFVHADTIPPENFTEQISLALRKGWVMGCFRYRFDTPRLMLKINAWFTKFHFMFCQGGDKTFFIEKAVFSQMNGYDEQLIIMEEYDFLKRSLKSGLAFTVMPATAIVSARKYAHRSWLRVQIANLVVFNLWRFGLTTQQNLTKIYKKILS